MMHTRSSSLPSFRAGAQHCCAPFRHDFNHPSFRAHSPCSSGLQARGIPLRFILCLLVILVITNGKIQPQASRPELQAFSNLQSEATGHDSPAAPLDLTVHEWGTFTSVSGVNGRTLDWLPLTGSTDLPSFVEHFRDVNFKGGLRGTVRMETPVLYFYSPQEIDVSVDVSFRKGLITEWYPRASSVNPGLTDKDHSRESLGTMKSLGSISWNSVHIDPHAAADFAKDNSQNHYYAARQTSSAPLAVSTSAGPQRERFLFYRGVADFRPPLTATISADNAVSLQNDSSEAIPSVILFERRGEQMGYRVLGALQDEATLTPPPLDGSLDSLASSLEGILISQGLFADEAHAMLETWKNSWFEEGSRLIFIVPRAFVDSVLPLHINPAPSSTTRVFVGRLELVTPATEKIVESAFVHGDRATLLKYSRFLEPILVSMIQQTEDEARQQQLFTYLSAAPTP
jgi:hypothetical protein